MIKMEGLITIAGGVVLSLVTYYLGKKKTATEIQKTELDSVETAVSIWRQLATDMKADMEKWKNTAVLLQEQVAKLQQEVEHLHFEINELKEENKLLRK